MSQVVRWCLGVCLLIGSSMAWGELCIQRATDLEMISGQARKMFGPGWRSYLPMAHEAAVEYQSSETSKPKYPQFKVQRNALGLLEVKVGGETYLGQICQTSAGLRLDVLILGGILKGESVELRSANRPGEIIVAYTSKPVFPSDDSDRWNSAPVVKEWRYVIKDFDQRYMASTRSSYGGPRVAK